MERGDKHCECAVDVTCPLNLETESLLVGEKITLKLCCYRILAMENLKFRKTKENMILILGLE